MEVDEGSEVGATEREEYYEDLEDEHSDEEGGTIFLWRTFNMGKRNLNLELFVVVSWMNSWVSPFIIPDIICFGFLIFTLDTRMVKFFMKLGVKFHSFFLEKKG